VETSIAGISIGNWISIHILILTVVWAFTAQAWNIMGGYSGQFSFGHAAYMGIGAYATMALLVGFRLNPWVGLVVGGFIAAGYALIVGLLTLRFKVKGHFFALATLAFAEIVRLFITNSSELHSASGYFRPLPSDYGVGYGLVAFQFQHRLPYYYIIIGFLAIVTTASWLIKHSSVGLYLFAIRENEQAAESLGISPTRYKLFSMMASAFFTAWAGSFWAMYFATIAPDTLFDLFRNVEILLPALVGGLGTVMGPILGSFLVTPLSQIVRQLVGNVPGIDHAVFGILLVFIVLFNPSGMLGWPRKLKELRSRRR